MFKAIIIGSSGATGSQLFKKLLLNENCDFITTIGRKSSLNGKRNDKVRDLIIPDLLDLSSTKEFWPGNDVFFNCIGTTRAIAGSAQEFVNVEVGISNKAAKMAHKAEIPHATLISAAGVNPNIWAKEWIHPLFYMKTIGQKEQSILQNYTFKYTSIFKPGMLLRLQKKQTWFENFSDLAGTGLRVDILASAMMVNAEKIKKNYKEKSINYFTGNNEIKKTLQNM